MEKTLYALNLDKDNRILSVTYDKYAPVSQPRVDALPTNEDGTPANVVDYLYIDGEYVYSPLPVVVDNSARIAELKQMLADTDYIVIKIAEGAATWEEYPEIKEQRQAWRDEINRLEATE